jgi:hypothetical protein
MSYEADCCHIKECHDIIKDKHVDVDQFLSQVRRRILAHMVEVYLHIR